MRGSGKREEGAKQYGNGSGGEEVKDDDEEEKEAEEEEVVVEDEEANDGREGPCAERPTRRKWN